MNAPYTKGFITAQYVQLGKLKNIFEKRKLLSIAMKSLLRTSGSVSSSGEYLPSKIDNEVDTQQIAENFGEKYKLLYTKVPTDPMEIETLSNKLDYLCVNCNTRECRVTALDVRKAISRPKLKSCKSDGIDVFMSHHIIQAISVV